MGVSPEETGSGDGVVAPSPAPSRPVAARSAALVPLAVVLLAAVLRVTGLGSIDRIYFDESFYARDAKVLLEQGVEEERPAHPSVGKWLIATGIAAFGYEPFGWRIAAAVAGTLTVALTYAAGMVLFRRRGWATLAAVLVAVDGLAITTSRLAMLDAFLALFVVAGAACVLLHWRDGPAAREPRAWLAPGWTLWAAGIAFGLALATKWAALPALLCAGGLALWVELARRRSHGAGWSAVPRASVAVAVPLVVLPALVYVASYTGFLLNYTDSAVYRQRCPEQACPAPLSERVAGLVFHHRDLVRMHLNLPHTHPYRSSAASWPVLVRPVLAYLERCPTDEGPCRVPQGTSARVVMLGNPALWWPAAAAVLVLGWRAIRRRDRSAIPLVAMIGALYLPWLAAESGYLFYMTPVVPFLALALAEVLRSARWPAVRRAGPWVVVALAAAVLVFLMPIWYGLPLGPGATDLRLLFESWR